MNKLSKAFSRGKAFIPFITAGDPCLEVTEELVYAMAEAGADLIELGIPFSDPVAEGPAIQAADSRALSNGVTTDSIFEMTKRIHKNCDVPLAFMSYANPVFTYGVDRFMKQCRDTGVDAIIVPDVPFEEREELLPYCIQNDVALISIVAPTSKERIRMIVEESQGFVYCVSSLGVTGPRNEISGVDEIIRVVKGIKDIPCAVGFGISTPIQAAEIARFADGVIVGSAVVEIVGCDGMQCVSHVVEYVRTMKDAIVSEEARRC